MKGLKTILFGIALILFSIAAGTMNAIAWGFGGLGILIALLGLTKQD